MEHDRFHGALVSSLISDPFDLNHNLGAGLSRKSKLFFCIALLFVPIVA